MTIKMTTGIKSEKIYKLVLTSSKAGDIVSKVAMNKATGSRKKMLEKNLKKLLTECFEK